MNIAKIALFISCVFLVSACTVTSSRHFLNEPNDTTLFRMVAEGLREPSYVTRIRGADHLKYTIFSIDPRLLPPTSNTRWVEHEDKDIVEIPSLLERRRKVLQTLRIPERDIILELKCWVKLGAFVGDSLNTAVKNVVWNDQLEQFCDSKSRSTIAIALPRRGAPYNAVWRVDKRKDYPEDVWSVRVVEENNACFGAYDVVFRKNETGRWEFVDMVDIMAFCT